MMLAQPWVKQNQDDRKVLHHMPAILSPGVRVTLSRHVTGHRLDRMVSSWIELKAISGTPQCNLLRETLATSRGGGWWILAQFGRPVLAMGIGIVIPQFTCADRNPSSALAPPLLEAILTTALTARKTKK